MLRVEHGLELREVLGQLRGLRVVAQSVHELLLLDRAAAVLVQELEEPAHGRHLRVILIVAQSAHALELGEANGFRNAQVSVIAPTGTIGLIMDCDTTGIEPDFALVKHKTLAGGGDFRIINRSVPRALDVLGYSDEECDEIVRYATGHGTLVGAPAINHDSLAKIGFSESVLNSLEQVLGTAFELRFAFNKWTLGEEFCRDVLNLTEDQINNPVFDFLPKMGSVSYTHLTLPTILLV